MTGRQVAGRVRDQRRLVRRADGGRVAAARMEVAAARRVDRARHVALEHDALALRQRIGDRHRREQRLGVRMDRPLVELLGRRELDDLAEVHDGDAVGDVAHDAEVVRDEDVGQRELVLQVVEQVHDLRLDRDVERGDGLVGDDQPRIQRERAGDADALALAARELVRIAVVVLGREPDDVHQLLHAPLRVAVRLAVDDERVGDDRAHALARVERGRRILEDHLHLAPQRPQRAPVELRDVAARRRRRCPRSARAAARGSGRASTCRSRTRRRGRASRPRAPRRRRRRRPARGRPRAAARRCP